MIYKPKNFKLQELVHPDIFLLYGERAWGLLDSRMLHVLQHFKDHFDTTITINNYLWGGERVDSGLRTTYGSSGSAHRFGNGFDLLIDGYNPPEVHEYILKNQSVLFEIGLRRIESLQDAPSWMHLDGKPAPMRVNADEIQVFTIKK